MMKNVRKLLAFTVSAVTLLVVSVTPASIHAQEENDVHYMSYSVSFIDSSTDKEVDNINARICKREYDINSPYFFVGDKILVAEWNSSDAPKFQTETFVNDLDKYQYRVYVDRLPDGYVCFGDRDVDYGLAFSDNLEGNVHCVIKLDRGEPILPDDFKLEDEFSVDIKVMDKIAKTSIENVQCELYRSDTGEVLATWNTSDTPVMHVDGLRYKFESRKQNAEGRIEYNVKATSYPDGYEVYPKVGNDEWYLCGFTNLEFINGNELERTLYLLKKDSKIEEPISTGTLIPYYGTTTSQWHGTVLSPTTNTTTVTSTTATIIECNIKGDANLDGKATIADAVAILQHIANRDRYALLPQGMINADIDGERGVTANDARALQVMDAEGHISFEE